LDEAHQILNLPRVRFFVKAILQHLFGQISTDKSRKVNEKGGKM
jgi:hypothetical protein